jgi:hypothetical protein
MELHFKELIKSIYRLVDPRTTENFFKELKFKQVKEMFIYLLILGLFTFFGYFFRYGFFSDPRYPEIAFKLSLIIYLIGYYIPTGIIPVFIMGYILHKLGSKLVGRGVKKEEAVSIIGYSTIPQLIGGFFGIILETWVLHILLMIYSIYLLYIGIKVRFGFGRSIKCFIFLVTSGFIVSMILFKLGVTILGIPGEYYGVR